MVLSSRASTPPARYTPRASADLSGYFDLPYFAHSSPRYCDVRVDSAELSPTEKSARDERHPQRLQQDLLHRPADRAARSGRGPSAGQAGVQGEEGRSEVGLGVHEAEDGEAEQAPGPAEPRQGGRAQQAGGHNGGCRSDLRGRRLCSRYKHVCSLCTTTEYLYLQIIPSSA